MRYILYSIAVTVAVLAIGDAVITLLEEQGAIKVTRADDQVSTIAGDPWMEDSGRYVLTAVARNAMVPMSFSVKKPTDGFRAFLVGGSFMRGVPYEGAGTIRFWLYRELRRRFPDAFVEVINAAATSQNSHRVREITQFAVRHEPDVVVIASCNNEGALPPGEVQKRLQRSGTFRLLKSVLRPERDDDERPLHTPQDPDIDAVRAAFRENLVAMVQASRSAGAAVYLCTLPLNLRYEGNSPGRPIDGPELPDSVSWANCVNRGYGRYEEGDYRAAIEQLSRCDEVEALRWIGLSHYALGEYDSARRILEQYTEVEPRNRCRPSFQRVIREVASTLNVPLVDLETTVNNAAPHGIPGPEHFATYCHMTWQGQALVADTILQKMSTHQTTPSGRPTIPEPEKRKDVFEGFARQPASSSYEF